MTTALASLTTSQFFPIRGSWRSDVIASPNGRGVYFHNPQYGPCGSFNLSNPRSLRVDLAGDQTQRVFNQVLTNLARTAPPIPGFRRQKGGKTSKVPTNFLLQMLGEERVTKFVIQEILNSTMADYVRKENLDVKDQNVRTIETVDELKKSFTPGNQFGFSVIIEPQSS